MTLINRHAELLEARGLDIELLERYGVSSCDRRSSGDWIEIPYIVRERVVNRKYRTISGEKQFAQDKGGEKCFWNHDVLLDESLANVPLIVAEGEFDALTAIQCGFVRAVSVPEGAPAAELGSENLGKKYAFLQHASGPLGGVKEFIIASDDDAAGANLLSDLSLRFGRVRCRWLSYPDGCKDLNDVLVKHGPATVVEVINAAAWCKIDGVYRMSQLPPRTPSPCYKIGIPVLENHCKIRLGDFWVVSGIPGHGKTSLMNSIACRMAYQHDWTIAVASFEQEPQTDHRRALRKWFNRMPESEQGPHELLKADNWIDQHFLFMVPSEDEECSLEWLLEKMAAAVVRHGATMIVIDPWNEMDHARPPDVSLTEYVGYAIKMLKRFARKYAVQVTLVAHPTKLTRFRNKDGDEALPCPTLYDISDSAHFANKPDVGIIIYRRDNETTVHIMKARYPDETGETGAVKMHFLRYQGRFEAVDR